MHARQLCQTPFQAMSTAKRICHSNQHRTLSGSMGAMMSLLITMQVLRRQGALMQGPQKLAAPAGMLLVSRTMAWYMSHMTLCA